MDAGGFQQASASSGIDGVLASGAAFRGKLRSLDLRVTPSVPESCQRGLTLPGCLWIGADKA